MELSWEKYLFACTGIQARNLLTHIFLPGLRFYLIDQFSPLLGNTLGYISAVTKTSHIVTSLNFQYIASLTALSF